MKRKVYTTRREQMTDQIIGFLAFPLVNVPLWIILLVIPVRSDSTWLAILAGALPWLVNGIVLILALLLRPWLAVGYLAFVGAALAVVTALSIMFVAACFVTFVTILSFPDSGDQAGLVFIVLMAVGLVVLGGIAIAIVVYVFQKWRSA
jgi:hypothetical protein